MRVGVTCDGRPNRAALGRVNGRGHKGDGRSLKVFRGGAIEGAKR